MFVEHVSTYVPKSAPRGALREAQDGEQVRKALNADVCAEMLKVLILIAQLRAQNKRTKRISNSAFY